MKEVGKSSLLEILKIIPLSFSLDLSFICYMLVIIIFLLWIDSFLKQNAIVNKVVFAITVIFLLLSSLVNGGEVALYSEWQTKLNFTALSHLSNPSEVFSTASWDHILTLLFFLCVSVFFIKIYKNKVHKYFPFNKVENTFKTIVLRVVILLLTFGLLLIGIRGGLQPIPISQSAAYFSNNLILNDIAVNPNWNIAQSILKSKSNFYGNPYKKYSYEQCSQFISELYYVDKDTTNFVLTSKDPNIVFILLESWSADNVESLGGLDGITPNFKDLEKEGLLFTDFYSNGWTSDQAMSSIFSSFPVFPYVAIVNQADKSRRLPSLNKTLITYNSSYFFGGDLNYGNIKAYLLSNGFEILKDQQDYTNLPSGRLGVHDEFMFNQYKKELSSLDQPFLSALFTLSSHSPYDFPADHKLSFNSREDQYVNSVAYTDKCLGDFMQSVNNEDWYSNTLFVIVADHSHNSPKGWRLAQKEKFKIPMLWYGEVLKEEFRGKIPNKMGSHIDIVPSILSQLNIDDSKYHWGRDLFNMHENVMVPYAFHKGYGIIQPDGYYAFNEIYQRVIESEGRNSEHELEIKKRAEMFFQFAFKEYMDL